ncbi:MAG: hypothetical protein AMXMBFR45_03490 [Gammaproteobacteria bacterium]|nr:MAG: hypothetical protein BroJett010_26160 [Gammaproteobacteria bacterium]
MPTITISSSQLVASACTRGNAQMQIDNIISATVIRLLINHPSLGSNGSFAPARHAGG